MRRAVPNLLAMLLGVAAALLVACGEGTSDGVPTASAGDLKSQIEDVAQAVDDGRCSDVPGQLKQVDERIDALPSSTDTRLVRRLRDGADRLRRVTVDECNAAREETRTTETTTTDTTTEPPPEETETVPEETIPTPTTTVPPPQPPPVPTTPTPVPTVPEPPPPPTGEPGGGVEPVIP